MAKHTLYDAKQLLEFLQERVDKDAKLIGSLGRGVESDHDIDVLLPNKKKTKKLQRELKNLLDAERCEETDWGGLYLYDSFYGDIDIFFTTKDFDY